MTDRRSASSPKSSGTADDVEALLNNSSLGSVGARRLRARIPLTTHSSILDQVADRRHRQTPPMPSPSADLTPPHGSVREHAAISNDRHVVPNSDGGWDVRKGDSQRISSHHATQAEAQARAREIVHNAGGGEVIVHGRDGAIRAKKAIATGKDPFPPRG